MAPDRNERTWLSWLVKVRIIIITFLLAIGLFFVRFTGRTNVDERLFFGVIVVWYTIAVFYVVLQRLWPEARLQARLQLLTDIALSTLLIHITGGLDTSFNLIYLLFIIIASIVLPRWWAYMAAALSFIGYGAVLELAYYDVIRSFSVTKPDLRSLEVALLTNFVGYVAIAYLSSNLSQLLRQVDTQLQEKSGSLEDLQARHEHIIHSMRGGLITTGLDGRITLLNAPGERLLGRTARELFDAPVDQLFLDALPATGESATTGEVRYRTPSGADKSFGVTVTPLTQSGGNMTGYVYTFDDLTDIRRLEREVRMRDRLAAVGRMAAGIAHEIRNPLASIAGSVQVLSGIASLTDEQKTLVDVVNRESERLNDIISDFLVYSRDKNLKLVPTDLVPLLADTLILLQNHPRQGSSQLEIVRSFAVEEAFAQVDGDRMKQVFWNLAENALKAMPNGGRLLVSLDADPDDTSCWRISFADNGSGIDQQFLEKIFEPFQSNFGGGTGLGLAIVYQIVQAHDGKISVRSNVGSGTEFILRIKRSAPGAEGGPEPLFAGTRAIAGGPRA